jgi:hypothetical protein
MSESPRATTRAQFRKLEARGETIYFRSIVNGQEVRRSLGTSNWHAAAQMRDAIDAELHDGLEPVREVSTFAEAAAHYLGSGMAHLAGSTREDREGYLRRVSAKGRTTGLSPRRAARRRDPAARAPRVVGVAEVHELAQKADEVQRRLAIALEDVAGWAFIAWARVHEIPQRADEAQRRLAIALEEPSDG